MFDVVVNELLIHDVDQGTEEEDGVAKEGHAPHWEKLDEVVGEKGSSEGLSMLVHSLTLGVLTYRASDRNTLSKHDPLSLDNEEVDELLKIIEGLFQCLFWDLVVFARTNGSSDATVHDCL